MTALLRTALGGLTRPLAARAASRAASRGVAAREQQRCLGRLVAGLARASTWKQAGMERGMTEDEFRRRIPLSRYEDLAGAIDKAKAGQSDVLWPGRCRTFAVSSGTTAGRTKYLPITVPMLAHFRAAGLTSLLFYSARRSSGSVFAGRHLFLGGATSLSPLEGAGPGDAVAGDLSGIAAQNLPAWARALLYEPGDRIASMTDWPAKIEAIARRCLKRDIRLLAGIPTWSLILAEAVRRERGSQEPLSRLWPNLECFMHGGVPIGPFEPALREALGPRVHFHEVYPASEGFVAAQDGAREEGLRLLTGCGIHFEFLPMEDWREGAASGLGTRALSLEGVVPGKDYALVLTTPAGLARYLIGDVIRFVSADPPRIQYAGRTQLQLSAFGEHVLEKEVTDALAAVSISQGWQVAEFHVAPLFSRPGAPDRGRHEWWLELKSGLLPDPQRTARELDGQLRRLNDDYDAKRGGAGLAEPVVRVLPRGSFEHWLKQRGKWGGQHKLPRCRSDREVAEQLTELTAN